jgi:hypothetical protein
VATSLARRLAVQLVEQRAQNRFFDAPDKTQRIQGEIVPTVFT